MRGIVFKRRLTAAAFVKQFGEYNEKTHKYKIDATYLSFLNSFPLLVYVAGILIATLIGNRWGRRLVFCLMQLMCITGIAVTYSAKSFGQVLAGRCLVQAHIGMLEWLIPMYQAEIVPAAIRGRMVILFIFEHQSGALISSLICNFTSRRKDNSAWQIPVGLMFLLPSVALLLNWLVPESPRWLCRQGRYDDAAASLNHLYGCCKDYDAQEETALLKAGLEEADAASKGTWAEVFKGTNRRRTILAMSAAAFSMLSGNAFSSHYGTVFLKSIGAFDAFTGTMIQKAIVVCGPITSILVVDRIGRRKMFLIWGSFASAALITMASLGTHSPLSMGYKKGIVAMAIFFPYARIVSFGAMGTLLPAEVPHPRLRDKTCFVAWSTQNCLDFLTSFTLPYLLDDDYAGLGARVGFIYGGFAFLGILWGIFVLPELKGRSLEEIEEMFEQRVSAWKSRTWKSPNADSVGVQVTDFENDPTHHHIRHVDSSDKLAGLEELTTTVKSE
ncbi:uncharacterized protein PV07_05432 [Cladophialophora immunda]|uniref:Major facilitator superfamily (MFS) profile domain-containing protein n=1 Tax=Cladophialophora immunda TaxID=569365 RepID=A0A0D2D1J6_9EURO|nr:uncharacterized protein PV07_05432 [Cladophialophora immunda]KIW29629.1 hypothetical protein PV07_05432 [Cladophialophora immunda]